MKHLLLFSLTLVFLSCEKENEQNQICDNYIITGDTTGNCIVHFYPDDFYIGNNDCEYYYNGSKDIDLNQDGIIDFQLHSISGCGQGAGSYKISIILKNDTEITADTIEGNYVFALDSNVNINNHPYYVNDEAIFSKYWWTMESGDFYEGFDRLEAKFVGMRIFTDNDTLHVWLKVFGDYREIEIIEYAYN